jgi:pimeloyl-ACP methyl ester carboxylesterase
VQSIVRGQGHEIVLVPGLASGAATWTPLIAAWGDRVRTHALTLPGFDGIAPSRGPSLRGQVRAVTDYARQLEAPVLVGHSLGGYLVLAAAAEPDVEPATVVVGDGLAAPAEAGGVGLELMSAAGRMFADRVRAMAPEAYAAHMHGQFAAMVTDPAQAEPVIAAAQRSDPETVATILAELLQADLRPRLHEITVPVLAIAPTQPTEAAAAVYRRQLGALPRCRLEFWDAVRHFIPVDAPRRLAAAIDDWLD